MKKATFLYTYHPENNFRLSELVNVDHISKIDWNNDVNGLVLVVVDGLQHYVKQEVLVNLITIEK